MTIAIPDLRGFGTSFDGLMHETSWYGPAKHVGDLINVLDDLGWRDVAVVGFDLGANLAQRLALSRPDVVSGLMLCTPAFAGIGARRIEPAVARETWYQQFHQLAAIEAT